MKINDKFTFGQYEGKTIKEVWVGKSFDWEQTNNIQNTFIHEMVDYITHKDGATVVPLHIDD